MKWIYFFGVVMLAPILVGLLQSNRRYLVPTCFALGLSMLMIGPSLWSAPIGWPMWPAPVKGIEISFVDSISVALLLSTRSSRIPLSIKLSFAIICLALLVSTIAAINHIAALFYIWTFLRTTLLFIAIARVCAMEPRAPMALFSGLGLGLVGELIWVVVQLGQGAPRPGGSLGHSNTMGIAADFVIFPSLALMLGGRRWFLPAVAVLAGGMCAVLGGSRASLGLFGVGVLLTTVLSIMHKPTSRKFAFSGAMLLLMLVSVPAMIWSEQRRSQEDKASSDQQRAAMKEAAKMIIADHPLGVGANQYVVVANVGGYSARAGVAWNWGTRNAPVHDTYYLVTAEMGFLGLIGLLTMFGSVIALGFTTLRRHLPDENGALVPGLLAAAMIVSVHIAFEFAFMEFVLHYLFAMCAGALVAIWARAKEPARSAAAVSVRPGALSHAG